MLLPDHGEGIQEEEENSTEDGGNTSSSNTSKEPRHASISESFSNASCNSDAADVIKERITRK